MFEQTASLWRRLLGRPKPAPHGGNAAVDEDERRAWVRFPADVDAHVITPNNPKEPGSVARVYDISRGGARLVARHEFEPGSLLTVVLPAASGKSSLAVLACVVHCQMADTGEWHVGCSFSAELSDEDLRAFGAVKARSTTADHRTWQRTPCDVTAVVQRLSDNDPKRYDVRVRDISASGVAFLSEEEIPAGTLLSAELHGAHDRKFTILACVVHVTEADGAHLLGCNFIRELTHADLEALM